MEHKIDKLQQSVNEIKISLAVLVQRTEHQIERLDVVDEDVSTVKIHVNRVQGIVAFILSAGAVAAFVKLLW